MSLETETATRTKRNDPSASELIIRLHDRYPHETRDELRIRFRDRARDFDNVLDEISDSFFNLTFNTLTGTSRRERSDEQKRKETAAADARAETAKKLIASRLLDLMQANGKPLGECTFADAAKLGTRYAMLAAMGKPNQIIGKTLTEAEVKAALL